MSSLSAAPLVGKSGDPVKFLAGSLLLRRDGLIRYRNWLDDEVLLRDGFHCGYCGIDLLASLDSFLTLTKDHLIPRSAGGGNGNYNRIASCPACDRLKSNAIVKDLAEARQLVALLRKGSRVRYEQIRSSVRVA